MPQDPTNLTPDASDPSPPTHQGLSLLDFLSPGSPALPHHLDRRSDWVSGGLQGERTALPSDWVSGGLQGERTALPSTKMCRATQLLSGNLLALLTIPALSSSQPWGPDAILGDSEMPALQGSWSSGREGLTQSQSRVVRAKKAEAMDTGLGTAQGMSSLPGGQAHTYSTIYNSLFHLGTIHGPRPLWDKPCDR